MIEATARDRQQVARMNSRRLDRVSRAARAHHDPDREARSPYDSLEEPTKPEVHRLVLSVMSALIDLVSEENTTLPQYENTADRNEAPSGTQSEGA